MRLSLILACICGFAGFAADQPASSDDAVPSEKTGTKGTGLSRDLHLLRKTITLPDATQTRASSKEAIEAAERVFGRINFIGMSKEHVLWILGDPETISDYGKAIDSGEDAPLLYRFDTGFGGSEYLITFTGGHVQKVEKRGTY